jgi:hypothetical protein
MRNNRAARRRDKPLVSQEVIEASDAFFASLEQSLKKANIHTHYGNRMLKRKKRRGQ